jgi:hypothetical protein
MSQRSELSDDRRRGLDALLDTLIPECTDAGLPGAGAAGVLDHLLVHAALLTPALLQALADLDAMAREAGADDFAALPPGERAGRVRALSERDPGLLPGLIFQVYSAYYQQAAVVEALGLPHRPPFPEGHALDPTDPARLDSMRQRPPLYREA